MLQNLQLSHTSLPQCVCFHPAAACLWHPRCKLPQKLLPCPPCMQWGTVCSVDALFDAGAAVAACAQLRYPGQARIVNGVEYSSDSTLPIIIRDVYCAANQTSLNACSFNVPNPNNIPCQHSNDVGLVCTGTVCAFSSAAGPGASHSLIVQQHIASHLCGRSKCTMPLCSGLPSANRVLRLPYMRHTSDAAGMCCRYRAHGRCCAVHVVQCCAVLCSAAPCPAARHGFQAFEDEPCLHSQCQVLWRR